MKQKRLILVILQMKFKVYILHFSSYNFFKDIARTATYAD